MTRDQALQVLRSVVQSYFIGTLHSSPVHAGALAALRAIEAPTPPVAVPLHPAIVGVLHRAEDWARAESHPGPLLPAEAALVETVQTWVEAGRPGLPALPGPPLAAPVPGVVPLGGRPPKCLRCDGTGNEPATPIPSAVEAVTPKEAPPYLADAIGRGLERIGIAVEEKKSQEPTDTLSARVDALADALGHLATAVEHIDYGDCGNGRTLARCREALTRARSK